MDKVRFVPLSLLLLYTIKMLSMNSSLSDALTIFVLGGVSVLYEWKLQNKRLITLEQTVSEQLEELQTTVNDKTKEINEIRTYVSSLKLGMIKNSNLGVKT